MSKLTKAQARDFAKANEILTQDHLSDDDALFVMRHWRADAQHVNTVAGAFFTPPELARDMAFTTIGCGDGRIIDLCAGIGTLAYHYQHGGYAKRDLVCVEINPEYVEVGKKLVPEAEWICANVFDVLEMGLGAFDWAISNPPFGAINRDGNASPRYMGAQFEYHVMDIAAHLADFGAFILPQTSTRFRYSGEDRHTYEMTSKHQIFVNQTNILTECTSVDTEYSRKLWHGVSPKTEIAICDFEDVNIADLSNTMMEAAE